MAYKIVDVRWKDGFEPFDLHILPGTNTGSPALRDQIVVEVEDLADQHHSTFTGGPPPGGDLSFVGEFIGQPSSFGVTLDPTSGAVTATSPLPADHLFNFTIHARAKDANNVVAPMTPRIRVHVHKALAGARLWLTPNPLSIRVKADGQRLSVLAEFDDQTVGDLTRMPGLQWASNDASVQVLDAATGTLKAVTPAGQATVTVTLPAAWGGVPASASVKTLVAWDQVPAKAFRVRGAVASPDAPDILFLPDGFDAGATAQATFEQTVSAIVKTLRTNLSSTPLNLFDGAINYWRAWIDAPGAQDVGCSILHEVSPDITNPLTATAAPLPVAPAPGSTTPWAIDELIDQVGLPLEADIGATFPTQLAYWVSHLTTAATAGVPARPGGGVPAVFDQWVGLSERRLLDERNSLFGVAAGNRPRRDGSRPTRALHLNPMRTTRAHLDQLLAKLKDGDSATVIGDRWVGPNGASRSFVFLVSNVPESAGSTGDVVALSLVSDSEFKVKVVANRRLKLEDPAVPDPRNISLDLTTTIAHEAGHTLGLGDEYADPQGGPLPAGGSGGALNLFEVGPTTTLMGNALPWNWPRISEAAALTDKPSQVSGDRYRVPVKPGDEKRFASGQTVELRKRPLVASTAGGLSTTLKVAPLALTSGVVIADRQSGTLPSNFAKGDLLFTPVLDGAGGHLGLVSKPIRDFINTSHQTLETKAACDSNHPNADTFQHGRNIPTGLPDRATRIRAFIVGAWRGGSEFECGVVHPTGACLMRTQIIPLPGHHSTEPYQLCQVCLYILVDKLDPSQHRTLETYFKNFYPA